VLAVGFVVAAPEEADPGQGVFGTTDEVVAPEGGEEGVSFAGFEDGVGLVGLFPAGEGVSVLLAADLPAAGVSTEEGDVSTCADEGVEVVAHGGGPVFVVADAEDESPVFQDIRVEFEIAVGGEGQADAVFFGPGDEGLFPPSELAGRRAEEGDAVALDFVAAVVGVEAETAPVVVGVVGVGGEFEEDGGGICGVWRFAEDEVAGAVGSFGGEGDVVVAGFPIGGEGDGDTGGPVAAVGGGIFGSGVGFAGDVFVFPDGDAFGPEAGEFRGEGGGAG